MKALQLYAPPKLNRYLGILGRRSDGFHELELVTTILEDFPELSDCLACAPCTHLVLHLQGPFSKGLKVDESNLVIKAWRKLEEEVGHPLPAQLSLDKRIPHGAGLGGGSSDAATALRLGNTAFDLNIPQARLLELAAQLGSDVPLFLLGKTVLGLGRGERVFPLRSIPLEPMLLVYPGLHVPTPEVYRALSRVGYPPPSPLASMPEGAIPPWINHLTEAALLVCPDLAKVREALLRQGAEPLLCGSGSCWVGRFPSTALRDRALAFLRVDAPEYLYWSI